MKLIAEPWDMDTYQVENFPMDWCEWNGRFRDTVRRFVKGDGGQIGDLAPRFSGSPDLFRKDGWTPYNSINFITCHDGFTLYDLFSYNSKHNEDNLEENRDGTDDDNSWNCGVEGENDDSVILELRKKLAKNAMCILFLSLGTSVIYGGDEFLRTQKGNNNAYCQDNNMTWFNWKLIKENNDFLEFTRELIRTLKRYEAYPITKYFDGQSVNYIDLLEVKWFDKNLETPQWENSW